MNKIICMTALLGLSLVSTNAMAGSRGEGSSFVIRIDGNYTRGFDDHRYRDRSHYRDNYRTHDFRQGYRQGYRDGLRDRYHAGHRFDRKHPPRNHRAVPNRNARTFFGR